MGAMTRRWAAARRWLRQAAPTAIVWAAWVVLAAVVSGAILLNRTLPPSPKKSLLDLAGAIYIGPGPVVSHPKCSREYCDALARYRCRPIPGPTSNNWPGEDRCLAPAPIRRDPPDCICESDSVYHEAHDKWPGQDNYVPRENNFLVSVTSP